jgi:hypothetical protein
MDRTYRPGHEENDRMLSEFYWESVWIGVSCRACSFSGAVRAPCSRIQALKVTTVLMPIASRIC